LINIHVTLYYTVRAGRVLGTADLAEVAL